MLGALMCPSNLHERFKFHALPSYCRETARQSFNPNFSVHPVGKTMRWIEKKTIVTF